MELKTRKKLITIVIFLIILIALGYVIGIEYNKWWQVRKEYIKMGYASDKFPFKMYTAEELAEKGLWPEALPSYDAIPTRTRPEETYAKFRQALIDEDLDKAAKYFDEHYRTDWRKSLHEIKDKGFLQEMINDLPEKIENVSIDDSSTEYEYITEKNGKKYYHVMSFTKDKNGDWKLKDL